MVVRDVRFAGDGHGGEAAIRTVPKCVAEAGFSDDAVFGVRAVLRERGEQRYLPEECAEGVAAARTGAVVVDYGSAVWKNGSFLREKGEEC